MGSFISGLGQSAAGQTTGGILGIAFGGINDRRQYKQQKRLNELEREQMDYQQKLAYDMWLKTGYQGQMKQLKEAGLNPGLLYGMSGGGGATATAPSSNAAKAPTGGGEIQAMAGMGIQAGLAKAQMRVMESQAKLNEAQAAKTAGVDTEKTATETASLTQGITNQKVAAELQKIQTRLTTTQAEVAEMSKGDAIDYISWQTGKALEELEQAQYETFIDKATQYHKIDQIKAEMYLTWAKHALTQAQTGLTEQQQQNAIAELRNMIYARVLAFRKDERETWAMHIAQSKEAREEFINDVAESMKLPLNMINDAVDAIILKEIISPSKTHTPVQGFRR